MTRHLNAWLLALFVVIGIPYYWFFLDAGFSETKPKQLAMSELRELAASIEGQAPVDVRAELVARRDTSRNLIVAGWGLRSYSAGIRAFELVRPDERPIVINAGTSREAAERQGYARFFADAQARVSLAVGRAEHVVVLKDSESNNGGRAPTTAAQGYATRDGSPYAIAPGVVVIPTPGLQHGSRMVFARLADGRELLFAGPAALTAESLRSEDPPARWVTRREPSDFRSETRSWLMTINALRREAPQMTVLTGRDPADEHRALARFAD